MLQVHTTKFSILLRTVSRLCIPVVRCRLTNGPLPRVVLLLHLAGYGRRLAEPLVRTPSERLKTVCLTTGRERTSERPLCHLGPESAWVSGQVWTGLSRALVMWM